MSSRKGLIERIRKKTYSVLRYSLGIAVPLDIEFRSVLEFQKLDFLKNEREKRKGW